MNPFVCSKCGSRIPARQVEIIGRGTCNSCHTADLADDVVRLRGIVADAVIAINSAFVCLRELDRAGNDLATEAICLGVNVINAAAKVMP